MGFCFFPVGIPARQEFPQAVTANANPPESFPNRVHVPILDGPQCVEGRGHIARAIRAQTQRVTSRHQRRKSQKRVSRTRSEQVGRGHLVPRLNGRECDVVQISVRGCFRVITVGTVRGRRGRFRPRRLRRSRLRRARFFRQRVLAPRHRANRGQHVHRRFHPELRKAARVFRRPHQLELRRGAEQHGGVPAHAERMAQVALRDAVHGEHRDSRCRWDPTRRVLARVEVTRHGLPGWPEVLAVRTPRREELDRGEGVVRNRAETTVRAIGGQVHRGRRGGGLGACDGKDNGEQREQHHDGTHVARPHCPTHVLHHPRATPAQVRCNQRPRACGHKFCFGTIRFLLRSIYFSPRYPYRNRYVSTHPSPSLPLALGSRRV